MRPSYKGYLTYIEIQLSIMAAWKKYSLSVLRTSAQGYVANYERINRIFGLNTLFIARREILV
jgi:hypothetical protein